MPSAAPKNSKTASLNPGNTLAETHSFWSVREYRYGDCFRCVVRQALGNKAPEPGTYAHVQCNDSKFDFTHRAHIEITNDLINMNKVLLILESPHKSEFAKNNDGKFTAKWPAAGRTGHNIHKHLKKYVQDMPICIINAVQYQCSLNKHTSQYRNKVFTEAWENGYRGDFIERLNRYYRDNDIIINACTGAISQKPNKNLKIMVERDIVEAFGGHGRRNIYSTDWFKSGTENYCSDLGVPHPSSRHFGSKTPTNSRWEQQMEYKSTWVSPDELRATTP